MVVEAGQVFQFFKQKNWFFFLIIEVCLNLRMAFYIT